VDPRHHYRLAFELQVPRVGHDRWAQRLAGPAGPRQSPDCSGLS
jgi:hypothetical protein